MSPTPGSPSSLRSTRFETLEDRLALSAQPVADFMIDNSEIGQQIEYGEIAPSLENVNQASGVNYAHESFGFLGQGQTVAVIDSGIAYDHYALGGGLGAGYRVVGGWDFTEENDANPYDDGPVGFHGTHVAGIIGSSDATYTGVAPGADLVALRVFNDQGQGYFSWVENALQWVHDHRNDFANPITTVNLSLGTNWNSNSIPGWTTLENEFAQLKADGIFISVSAGNSFQNFKTAGLSYPAASPYVVPVASHGATGNLSSFSQRNERVIVAPGEQITSTIPAHLFGGSGPSNQFMALSGTSMAAPYLAGASVVLREAMQFAGYQNVTEDTLYDYFRDSSDLVWDGATNAYYHRLNLQHALDQLLPDDFGSTAADAHSLGTLSGGESFQGTIERLNDTDVFRFTAAHDGVISFATDATHQMTSAWNLIGGAGAMQDGKFTFDVAQGQTYTVSLASSTGLGHYTVGVELETHDTTTPVAWGVVSFQEFQGEKIAGENLYQLSASRAGLLTVEAAFTQSAGNVTLQLYNADGNLLASSTGAAGHQRLDVTASAGQSFTLLARGSNSDVDFRVTNLVRVIGNRVDVQGTAGDDTFAFAAGNTHRVSVNGVQYNFDGATTKVVQFFGGDGNDRVTLRGSAGDDHAVVRLGQASLVSDKYCAFGFNTETVVVQGGGGNDIANLYDSAGNDVLVASPGSTTLQGAGFRFTAGGFDRVNAFASAGNDRAEMYDSAGSDRFVARPTYGLLRGEGFFNYARGFDVVNAHAGSGGDDRAWLYDSAGNDRLDARPDAVTLSGAGWRNRAAGFSRVDAVAAYGGFDVADMYDSLGNDVFISRPTVSVLFGQGFYNCARGFDEVRGHSVDGGLDIARLYGSDEADFLTVSSVTAELRGLTYTLRASGFTTLRSNGMGGADQAMFENVAANQRVVGRGDMARYVGQDFNTAVWGFEHLAAYAKVNQISHAEIGAVDYLFSLFGEWE